VRQRYSVQTLAKRLARLDKDPWQEYWKTKQSITPAMWRALGKK
jgi:DNA primase